jgi:hypothetical protein
MKLKPGSPCRHCTAAGCGIYEERPQVPCVNFQCAWLQDPDTLPDEMRPDLCGAIVMLDRQWNGIKVITAVPTGENIPEAMLKWLRSFAIGKSTPLVFSTFPFRDGTFGASQKTGFGPPAFVKAVKESIGPEDIVKF